MTGVVYRVFNAAGDYFAVQDMTIGWIANHAVQVHGEADADYSYFSNVAFTDTGNQTHTDTSRSVGGSKTAASPTGTSLRALRRLRSLER